MDIRLHGDFRNEESVRKADEHEYSAVTRMLYHYFEQFIHLMFYFLEDAAKVTHTRTSGPVA